MGAFDVELAALGYRTKASKSRASVGTRKVENRKRVIPTVGMRVEYGYRREGTVVYVSDSLVVVRWDFPQKTKYGGWTVQEEAVPAHHNFYESKGGKKA